jgi:hypothetical protein
VWVEGSYDFRNPSEDLPSDWGDEQRRTLHYQALGKPLDAQAFVRLLRTRMEAALTSFNRVLPELNHLGIFRPRQNGDRGLWAAHETRTAARAAKPWRDKREDRQSLRDARFCSTFLLRLTGWSISRDFSRIRAHGRSAPAEALRPLLILDLFGEATNMGHGHINPYWQFALDLARPSFLEAA